MKSIYYDESNDYRNENDCDYSPRDSYEPDYDYSYEDSIRDACDGIEDAYDNIGW